MTAPWRNGGQPNAPAPPIRHPKPRFLTPEEVARALRVSKMTVYREIHSGELDAVRVGRAFRIFETSLSHYVAAHRVSLDLGDGGEWSA